jgi:hypothetical protein
MVIAYAPDARIVMSHSLEEQARTARRFGVVSAPPAADSTVGIARNVKTVIQPLNALRHRPENGTSGWYIWRGEVLSDAPGFFEPLHVSHLAGWCPQILPYLGLPPGWRVLVAPGHEDVWFDATLLAPGSGT